MRSAEERFWEKVDMRAGPDACWLWTASLTGAGYGQFWLDPRIEGAHRVSYMMLVGPIPVGHELDHLCSTPRCVNPKHLEPVHHVENVRRGRTSEVQRVRHQKRTHCKHGHEFVAGNTYRRPDGSRTCRTCHRAAVDRHREAAL